MTLRTTALIAGALGLLLLIGGLIADAMRPAAFGTPAASLETSTLLIGPDMIAMAPGGTVTVEGDGAIVAYSGRVADAEEWAATRDATEVTGVPTWEELETASVEAAAGASASPSPSAEPTTSPSAEPSAEPTTSSSASAEPSAEPTVVPEPADIWRDTWSAENGELTLETDELPVGLEIVVESVDGSPLSEVSMRIDRVVNDGWITPLMWWGAFLTVVGLIALVMMFIDHRQAGSKVETAVAGRRATGPAAPGGRRDRREALTASGGIPLVTAGEARLDDETDDTAETQADVADDASGDQPDGREERA